MSKFAVSFRLARSKKRNTRNVLTERDEADASKVLDEIRQVLADEYRVKPDHVVLLEVAPREIPDGKPWKLPANGPKPADDIVMDDDYTGPTRKQIAEMRKADLIDLVIAQELEVDTDGNVESLRAGVMKALNPPR